ncbi:CBO0543 family protein [Alicyclobacillus sp.]|uniref:CBO0543 family protein n=1 Tax=Alicyclobacillus sp. TaxID=61169 RepID=UPI0025C63483|nr:CBO0543 family protein [Alicyclobacillus sp.]MCL6517442.1 hypothetical protein [Alicyclobacillus sp.]
MSPLHAVFEHTYDEIVRLHRQVFQLWLTHVVFTWRWWIALMCATVPWMLWLLWRNRASSGRLLCAGFFIAALAEWLDSAGVALGLWHYDNEILPMMPSFLPWDLTLYPVTLMTFLQVKPHGSRYLKAALFGALVAFIAEPLFKWIGLYHPDHWRHLYTFVLLFLIYLAADGLTRLPFHPLPPPSDRRHR